MGILSIVKKLVSIRSTDGAVTRARRNTHHHQRHRAVPLHTARDSRARLGPCQNRAKIPGKMISHLGLLAGQITALLCPEVNV